ncbi:hypothetical protein B0H10DRAFT_2199144 [Mycena sp. CBHHK59/15]|nr:hypothetical protein B0H10DRAFT_2199144 [Mycena sp. CBHHK59/15]
MSRHSSAGGRKNFGHLVSARQAGFSAAPMKIEGKNTIEGETPTREPQKPPRIYLAISHWFLNVTFAVRHATSPTLERRKCPPRPKHAKGGPDAAMSSTRKVGKHFHSDIVGCVRVSSSVRTPTAQEDADADEVQAGTRQDTPCPWVNQRVMGRGHEWQLTGERKGFDTRLSNSLRG